MGATASGDGESCLSWPSNISSTPTEVIEKLSPLRVLSRGLVPGSGGAGRHRGGLGQEIRIRNTSPTPTVAFLSAERVRIPAEGHRRRRRRAATGAVEINDMPVDPKVQHVLQPGDVVTPADPGGRRPRPPRRPRSSRRRPRPHPRLHLTPPRSTSLTSHLPKKRSLRGFRSRIRSLRSGAGIDP